MEERKYLGLSLRFNDRTLHDLVKEASRKDYRTITGWIKMLIIKELESKGFLEKNDEK